MYVIYRYRSPTAHTKQLDEKIHLLHIDPKLLTIQSTTIWLV